MSSQNNTGAQDEAAAGSSNENEGAAGLFGGALKQLGQINFVLIIGAFLFYFLGGFLLYGSLFAAVGAASDNETDTQQFMLPITIPLILGLLVMVNSFLNPSGKIAVIFSLIPLHISYRNDGPDSIRGARYATAFVGSDSYSHFYRLRVACRENLPHRHPDVREKGFIQGIVEMDPV